MYRGEHSIRFYPAETETKPSDPTNKGYIGGFPFDSAERFYDWPDTWRTWHLIPKEKVIFAPAKAKENRLETAGRHGSVDIDRYVRDHPVFSDRTGSIEFVRDPDYASGWPKLYRKIVSFFQGSDVLAVLRDDKAYYYKGRFSVSELKPEEGWDIVKLEYNLEPFKYYRWYGPEENTADEGGSGGTPVISRQKATLNGNEYIVTRRSYYLSRIPGYEYAVCPEAGQRLYLREGQTVELNGGQTIPEGGGMVHLMGNQLIDLAGKKNNAPLSVVLANGDTAQLPYEAPYANVYDCEEMYVPAGWEASAASSPPATGEDSTYPIRSNLTVTSTGEEFIYAYNREITRSGGEGVFYPANGTRLQITSGQPLVLEGNQTIHRMQAQTLALDGVHVLTLAPGQAVVDLHTNNVYITGSDWTVNNPSKFDKPAGWSPSEITWPGSAPPVSVDTGDGDPVLKEDEPVTDYIEPYGVQTVAMPGYNVWRALALPENCYATPEFKMTVSGTPEVSADEGNTWFPIAYPDWRAHEAIRWVSGRILLRGTGEIKLRLRGGWL